MRSAVSGVLLGRLQNRDIAARQRRGDLPRQHRHRTVPRNDLSTNPDRFAERVVEHRRIGGVGLAINLGRPTRVVAEGVGRAGSHSARQRYRHPVIEGFQRREFIGVFLDQIGDSQQIARALMRSDFGPFALLVSLARDFDRFVHIGFVALGSQRQHFLVGRVDGFKVLPDLAGTHLPPMRSCFCFFRKSSTGPEPMPGAAFSIEGTAAAIFHSPFRAYAWAVLPPPKVDWLTGSQPPRHSDGRLLAPSTPCRIRKTG